MRYDMRYPFALWVGRQARALVCAFEYNSSGAGGAGGGGGYGVFGGMMPFGYGGGIDLPPHYHHSSHHHHQHHQHQGEESGQQLEALESMRR